MQDSAGGQQFSRYDALDRPLSREQQVGGEPVTLVTWDYDRRTGDRSQVDRYAWVNGAWQAAGTTTYGYDDLGRLASLRQTTAAAPVLYDYAYVYDAADRLTSETLNGVTRTYGYDDAGQLTNDNGVTYSYDKAGNRTGGGYVTGPGNRLLSDGVWAYTYDDNGAMVGKSKAGESWTYGYDLRGQMTSAASGATSVSYAFDALGNRVQRQQTVGGVTTTQRFAYDGTDVWADLDGSNAVTARRVFGDGPDEVLARLDAGGAVAWYGTDRMGSVRTVFDNSGSVIASVSYDAFGGLIGGALADRYGYTGREHDALTGQRYHRARVADGHRWTTEDPIRDDEANLYRYVGNEPTGYTDPSGYAAACPDDPGSSYTPTHYHPLPNNKVEVWFKGGRKLVVGQDFFDEYYAKYNPKRVPDSNPDKLKKDNPQLKDFLPEQRVAPPVPPMKPLTGFLGGIVAELMEQIEGMLGEVGSNPLKRDPVWRLGELLWYMAQGELPPGAVGLQQKWNQLRGEWESDPGKVVGRATVWIIEAIILRKVAGKLGGPKAPGPVAKGPVEAKPVVAKPPEIKPPEAAPAPKPVAPGAPIPRGPKPVTGTAPGSYLDEAVGQQGLPKAPAGGLKQKWSEGGFDYEVRVHPADPAHGKTGSIYRVARRKQGTDAQGQGSGWEYMDSTGKWHPESTLKPGKPGHPNPT